MENPMSSTNVVSNATAPRQFLGVSGRLAQISAGFVVER
jgi:hypothetical protein